MAGRVEIASVAGAQPVGPALWLIHLDAPEIAAQARPGQFVLARCADPDYPVYDPYLPRAYFVLAGDRQAGRMSLLVEERGRGSAWLASRRDGDRVLVHGPIGREIRPARLTRHLLLLAEGTTAAAGLIFLAGEASQGGLSVTLVENTQAAGVPPALLRADVEYRATTPGRGGLLGILPGLLPWADEVVVAAPPALLDTLAALRRGRLEPFTLHAGLPVQALPLPDIAQEADIGRLRRSGGDEVPCGTGACGACVVLTSRGPRLFCRDGPAFPLEALRFESDSDEDEPENAVDAP
ncbi:MAG: hypothetical protein ACRDI2_04340 [Chloroflexota bacterium]